MALASRVPRGPQTLILHMGLTRQKRYSLSLDHVTVYNLNKESRFKSQFFVAERGLIFPQEPQPGDLSGMGRV